MTGKNTPAVRARCIVKQLPEEALNGLVRLLDGLEEGSVALPPDVASGLTMSQRWQLFGLLGDTQGRELLREAIARRKSNAPAP